MATRSGNIITVGDVADVQLQRQGPVQINHIERQRAVSIETALPDNIALEEAISARSRTRSSSRCGQRARSAGCTISSWPAPPTISPGCAANCLSDFHVAVILTYLLMAALFQSFTYPLVVMLTVPLATFGGVLGLDMVHFFDPVSRWTCSQC